MNEFPHSISSNNLLILPNRSWAQFFAKLVFVGGVSVCVVLIILYSIDLYRHGKEKDYIGWFSSAGFVLLTIPISLRLIVQHLTHWNSPNIQKYVVRIIWMIPIYSIESWLALRFKYMAIYLETLRECYEAYVILCFMYYLIALLGGDEHQIILRLKNRPADFGKHNWPISLFLNSWSSGTELLQKCKFGVFQYVFIKNMSALVVFTMHSFGVYKDGQFRFDNAFLYQCIISNLSQLWALYCLLLFYWATKEELASWRPVGKFLCVKSVVFFTWWQSICIELFLASPVGKGFASSDKWTVNEFSKGLQDYLICIEMFIASIAFSFAFSHYDYLVKKEENEEDKPFLSAFIQSAMPDDFVADFRRLTRIKSIESPRINESEVHETELIESSIAD